MKLWKAHGLGNDYLVWEQSGEKLTSGMVQKICHRHLGVGGDGILEPFDSERADCGVRIWNPDGSIAEKSGNGLRIFAYWRFFRKDHPNLGSSSFSIDTGFDVVTASVNRHTQEVTIGMGKAYFEPEKIPVVDLLWGNSVLVGSEMLSLWTVGLGNPHCVCFFSNNQELDALPWRSWGELLECDERFPNRTNVQFAQVLDEHTVRLRIWERGAGETSASGSSSCAVVAVAVKMGWVRSPVRAEMPGGILHVSVSDEFDLTLRGPVSEVASIVISDCLFG